MSGYFFILCVAIVGMFYLCMTCVLITFEFGTRFMCELIVSTDVVIIYMYVHLRAKTMSTVDYSTELNLYFLWTEQLIG